MAWLNDTAMHFLRLLKNIKVGLSPLPVTVANEGLGWDSLLKMEWSWWWLESWEGGQPNIKAHGEWQTCGDLHARLGFFQEEAGEGYA